MKSESFNYTSETSGVIESTSMGFDKAGEVFVFETLRRGIYSSPTLAVIREYSTNIFDSHVAAGVKDRPGEVTFPSFDKPEMIFRDFGLGMSQDDVRRIYSQYGASTKRNTNEQTGQLGLGSKAGFSYCDSFSIISRHNGIKSIYNAVIEEDGRGRINLLDEGETTEESGMEIIVPIKNEDIQTFIDTALEFYYYWDLRPILHNCFESYPEKKYIVKTENYGRIDENKHSIVLMGGVSYILDTKHLLDLTDGQRNTFNKQWVFFVPIGSVDFASSRETLRYTEKTIQKLTSIIISAITDYKFQMQVEFDACPTLKDAKRLFLKTKEESLFYRYCHSKVEWRGQEIKDGNYPITSNSNYTLFNYNYYRLSETGQGFISCNIDKIYYFTSSYLLKAKLDKLFEKAGVTEKNTFFIKISNKSKIEDFITENNLQEFEFIDLKTIELDREVVARSKNFNAKHQKKVFTLNDGFFRNSVDGWTITEVDMDEGGVYVNIDRFEVRGYDITYSDYSGWRNLENFTDKVAFARKFHPDIKIYGIETSLLGSLNSKWVELKNFCQQIVDKEMQNIGEQDYINVTNHEHLKDNVDFISKTGIEPQTLKRGAAKEVLKIYSELDSCPKLKKLKMIKEYGFTIPSRNMDTHIKIKIEDFNNRNPFLNYVLKNCLRNDPESQNFLIKNLA